MDDNINYACALQAVDTSVTLLDLSTISNTLQRFPVLQVRASQQLIREIPKLINLSEKSRLLRTIADAIGCIISPCGLLTTERKLCATNLYYGIRDQDEHLLHLLIKRMLEGKRKCFGCGLFVQTALSEALQLSSKLPEYVKRSFLSDDADQFESEIQPWREVLDLLQTEGFLKRTERSSDTNLDASSVPKTQGIRRLRLRMKGHNEIHKRRKRKASVPFRTNSSISQSRHERQLLLKLVTLYAACPDLVAKKIRVYGLSSYCSAKIVSLCDSLASSERRQFTADELRGMKIIGGSNMASMGCSNNSKGDAELSCAAGNREPLTNYRIWMPLAVGINNFIHDMQSEHYSIDSVLEAWTSAEGTFLSSVDQIIIGGLSNDRMSQNLLQRCLSGEQRAGGAKHMNGAPDTQDSSVFDTLRECFRMLDEASVRGSGYPTMFWEQFAKVFAVFEGAIISLLLHDVQGTILADLKRVITYIKNITGRLQDRVDYQPARPRTNTAAVKICDCFSVEMKWKEKRRFRSSVWRVCDCMNPNTVLLPVPKPGLWFSCMSGMGRKLGKEAPGSNKAMSISRWLYGNPAWRSRQYGFSKLEILHGIVNGILLGSCGEEVSEVADLLAQVLKDAAVRKNIFSVFAECSKAVVSEVDTRSGEKLLESTLRLVRSGVEKVWSIVGHQARASLFHIDVAIPSEGLGHVENMLTTVAPRSKALHGCIRDMPSFCEYVAEMYRLSVARESMSSAGLMRIRVITGLLGSQLGRKVVSGSDSQRRDSVLETVMLCFE